MKRGLLLLAILTSSFASSASHPAEAGDVSRLRLDGVAGFVEGGFTSSLKETLRSEATAWTAGAISSSISERVKGTGAGGAGLPFLLSDPGFAAEVEAKIRADLSKWLEEKAAAATRALFGAISRGEGVDEIAEMARRAARLVAEEAAGVPEELAKRLYESAVAEIRKSVSAGTAGLVDVTALRSSIEKAFDASTVARFAEDALGRAVGDSAAGAVRERIEDALGGRLPPEVVDAINRAPVEFESYASRVERNLPGRKLKELKDSILSRPILKIPTCAYAAILATSAAEHYARAYKGVTVDLYELKRAGEVTKVMIWQLENRKRVNLSVIDLARLGRGFARRIGMGGELERVISEIREPIDRVREAAEKIDEMVKKPIGEVRAKLKEAAARMQRELKEIQRKLTDPINEGVEKIDDAIELAGSEIAESLPDGFDGLPATWEELKEKLGAGSGKREAPALGPTGSVEDGELSPASHRSESEELDPVLLHNGEFVYRSTDVVIPGRGIDFRFERTCRARSDFMGEMGRRCTHSYASRLLPFEGGLIYVDEGGQKHVFRREGGGFALPQGLEADFAVSAQGYELSMNDGTTLLFDEEGRLSQKRDRYGNRILLRYSKDGLLSEIEDALGRKIRVERRSDGLISALRDFANRRFAYEYNGQGEMTGSTSPATPDFPSGKTTAYRYDRAHRMSMIVDPLGRPYLRNRYDDAGRIVGQRYGEGRWMGVAYGEGSGDVASRAWVTGADGSIRLYEHDVEGRLMRKWLYGAEGYRLVSRYAYDGQGRVVLECGRSGRCRAFIRSGEGAGSKLERVVMHPAGGGKPRSLEVPDEPASTVRNSFGQVVREGRGEEIIRYEYHSALDPDGDGVVVPGARALSPDGGYLKRIVRGEGFMEFKYDPLGNITSVSDGTGVRARFFVNALNQVTKEERPGEASFSYRYDACDNLVQVSERGGAARELRYDRLGRLVLDRLEFAPGRFADTAYSRNDDGSVAELSLPEGNRVLFEYDEEGMPLCVVRGAGSSDESRECVELSPEGDAVAFVDGEGFRTILERDGFGDLAATVDPLGNRSEFERDDEGRVTGRRDYDARGKLLAAARFSYSSDGVPEGAWRLLWRNDPAKARWVEWSGKAGAPVGAGGRAPEPGAKANDGPPSLSWNGNGLLSSITDGAGKTTRFIYDSQDRLVIERYPDGTERRTSYDGRGLVTRSVGRGGESLDMEYDAAGRLALRRASPARGADGARLQRFEYDGLGRMTLAVDEGESSDPGDDAVSRFVYDSLSRPVAEEAGGAWISREYDDGGMVTMLSLPSGEAFFFAYDGEGKLASVMGGGSRIASYEYDAAGRLSSERLGELPPMIFERDGSGKLVSAHVARGGRQIEGGFELAYGEEGLVSRERLSSGFVRSYERDASGRLVEASRSCGAGESSCAGAEEQRWSYEYDEGGGVKRRGSSLELRPGEGGRVAGIGELSFEYDAMGRLSRAARGGKRVASYSYDAFDRRIGKSEGENKKRFLWNGFQLVGEEGGGSPVISYAYGAAGSSPVAALSEGRIRYIMKDRLGSVSALVDSEGKAQARCSYGPYGEMIDEFRESCGANPFPFGFAGHIRDAETDLVYMRHRFYSPDIAGFLTPDPLDYKLSYRLPPAWALIPSTSYHSGQGGASRATFPNRPLSVSADYGAWPFGRALRAEAPAAGRVETDLHAYARGDPSTFVDPLGLAHLLFDRSDEELKLIMEGGGEWGAFAAANRTTRPGADPMRVGGNGPFPNGTYSIGLPEFYSEEYREEVRINYEMGILAPWETALTGSLWRRSSQSEENYHASYGRIRLRAGAPSDGPMWARGLFIHGGRHDFRKKTLGCIRVDDADLELLAIGMINLARDGDPVTSITVQD